MWIPINIEIKPRIINGGEGLRQLIDQVLLTDRWVTVSVILTWAVLAGVRVQMLGWDVDTYQYRNQT